MSHGRVAMVVVRFRQAAEETGTTLWRAIKSGRMSAELTEDGGAPNASLRQLPAPETIATNDLMAKLAAADAAISNRRGRHELFGHFGVAAFGNCMVVEAPLAQAGIAAPIAGDNQRAWHDGTLDKATQGIGAAVSSDGQSHSTGIAAILPLVLCRARLPVANLDSGGH